MKKLLSTLALIGLTAGSTAALACPQGTIKMYFQFPASSGASGPEYTLTFNGNPNDPNFSVTPLFQPSAMKEYPYDLNGNESPLLAAIASAQPGDYINVNATDYNTNQWAGSYTYIVEQNCQVVVVPYALPEMAKWFTTSAFHFPNSLLMTYGGHE
jgi:hypothetical protein